MKNTNFITLFLPLIVFLSQSRAQAQDLVEPDVGDPYPLQICILSGEILEEGFETFDHEGQEVRVCCEDCKTKFLEESYIRVDEINALNEEKQALLYPLDKCLVTGKPLSENVVSFVFRNRLFRLSSEEAKEKMKSEPGKYFGELDQAVIDRQKTNYPLKTCLVSGKKLSDTSVDYVIANQLVRLADFDQLSKFNENPGKYLAILREAR